VAAVRAEAGDYLLALREGAVGPEQVRCSVGEVLTGAAPGRTDEGQLTLFESVGLAAWDLVAARHATARARRESVGSLVPY
jgi:ornithine cyclodeaminase/alanine dehydrogenase-like protein (mu-crystallin family)